MRKSSQRSPSPIISIIITNHQVLVVGGGPSGLSAALAARRAGAEVILMERSVSNYSSLFKPVIDECTTVVLKVIGWMVGSPGYGANIDL